MNLTIIKSADKPKNFAIARTPLSQNDTVKIRKWSPKQKLNAKIQLVCLLDRFHVVNAQIFLRNAASCLMRHCHHAFQGTPTLFRKRQIHMRRPSHGNHSFVDVVVVVLHAAVQLQQNIAKIGLGPLLCTKKILYVCEQNCLFVVCL